MKTIFSLLVIFAVSAAFAAQAPAEKLFYGKCAGCHDASLALSKKRDRAGWAKTIDRMKGHGLDISGKDADTIAKYLAGRQ